MRMKPVDSKALAAVGYDRGRKRLDVQFTSGDVYRYSGVPTETYASLLAAASKGTFFRENIRDCFPSTLLSKH